MYKLYTQWCLMSCKCGLNSNCAKSYRVLDCLDFIILNLSQVYMSCLRVELEAVAQFSDIRYCSWAEEDSELGNASLRVRCAVKAIQSLNLFCVTSVCWGLKGRTSSAVTWRRFSLPVNLRLIPILVLWAAEFFWTPVGHRDRRDQSAYCRQDVFIQ